MLIVTLNQIERKTIETCILQDIESEEYSLPDFKDCEHMRFLFWRASILESVQSGKSEFCFVDSEFKAIETLLDNSVDTTRFDMEHKMPDFSDKQLMEFWMNRAELLEKLQSAN